MSLSLVLVVVGVVAVAAVVLGRRYVRLRGTRLVECPETKAPAAVEIGAARASVGGHLALTGCSRWPEKQACGRECLAQIERAPADCLVRTVVTKWYEGKVCSVCARPLDQVDWHERKPGVVDETGAARPWLDVPPEQLPHVLATHQPICFDCYVADTFRREHPGLVVDNPWRS